MPTRVGLRPRRKRRRKKQRSVYVIARPLKAAGPFSSSSSTEFALCHWGLFVTYGCEEGRPNDRNSKSSLSIPSSQGTLFELLRQENNVNTPYTTTEFGVDKWKTEWKYVLVSAVGETTLSDRDLREEASKITREYPDYDGYTNNCQNFVHYLLEFACPTAVGPKTIEQMVHAFIPLEITTPTVYYFLLGRRPPRFNAIGDSDNSIPMGGRTPSLIFIWMSVGLFE